MSLKAELETWAAALKAYDEEDFEKALDLFSRIADSSKILTNMGLIYATLGEHEAAVEQFQGAVSLDQYLAVAYFQCGVSNFLLGRYELALKDFDEALLYLRGNQAINYEQLGLKFKLFSAEVLFNKGLSQIYMGQVQEGLADMEEARREKATDEHNVIDDAIQDRGEGYTVFSIPVGVLYRPSENKLKNVKTKDYLGKAKLVAASDSSEAYTTFSGVTRLKQGVTPTGIFIEGGPAADSGASLGRSATALPKPSEPMLGGGGGAGLARAKTTLNVPANARERIQGLSPGGPPPPDANGAGNGPSSPNGAGVGRANTMTNARPPPGGGLGGPVRGLSVRKPGGPPPADDAPAPAPPAKAPGNSRLTEFYDDYIDSYTTDDDPPPLPNGVPAAAAPAAGSDRVGAWARANAQPQRGMSTRAPPSAYAPSSVGGGSMRRKLTRRGTRSAPSSRGMSSYGGPYGEEDEEPFEDDYEDMPFELVKIRVKLHYQDDVRGMALTPETPFEEFIERVTSKFGKPLGGLALKFKDEDGGKVSLRDESDYELAIETARESAKGKPEGKLEVWCMDI
ncbi:hypothetical protein PUNSTDRAFT_72366 [Punctularia strigosozonata HHB-11173 SS5]|uniref:uncharacterized protein n=1 Tax=Punctularia strigosozonata (strain HHB-11173) TaxID=741275 RepID=UPI0004416F02|nr:uncharacterized protein PUNSTDRAFT_72366 [Punctularia strigosozonata HHB-11173 SS5]EIN06661.1 hypothetical protein PUNSTDRAFT_72366 [Punctularia strigosozonata HHB-11173 SS5]